MPIFFWAWPSSAPACSSLFPILKKWWDDWQQMKQIQVVSKKNYFIHQSVLPTTQPSSPTCNATSHQILIFLYLPHPTPIWWENRKQIVNTLCCHIGHYYCLADTGSMHSHSSCVTRWLDLSQDGSRWLVILATTGNRQLSHNRLGEAVSLHSINMNHPAQQARTQHRWSELWSGFQKCPKNVKYTP